VALLRRLGECQRSPTKTMRSVSTLKSVYYDIAKRLNAPRRHVRFATTPQHDGSPHIESNLDEFAYVITERGIEHAREITGDTALPALTGQRQKTASPTRLRSESREATTGVFTPTKKWTSFSVAVVVTA
jgi:hypothetical protein